MRIATWNLERPARKSWKIVPRQRARLASVDADIWVPTETRASISPGDSYHGLHTPVLPGWSKDDNERMISIWSRWSIEPVPFDPNPGSWVSALVEAPEASLFVTGVVIPWANDKGPHGSAKMWEQHTETIGRLAKHWRELRDLYPHMRLIVAGDFNQDRDGSGWYGTGHVRQLLSSALEDVGLELLTDQDIVATGLSEKQHLVDHIAVTPPLAGASDWRLEVLPKTDADDVRLSDHPTVVVDAPGLQWPLPPAEQLDWEPVLAFLPALVGDDGDAGEWVAPREMSPGVFHAAIRHSVTKRSS